MDSHISFGKIVASPTFSSWSQVYSTGSLFAVISLSKTQADQDEHTSLSLAGKEMLDTLEQEYFSLEEKNLDTIRQTILQTKEKLPDGILLCFVVTAIVKNIAYLIIIGNGKIILKRQEKIGVLLSNSHDQDVLSASGVLKPDDLLILQTQSFAKLVSFATLKEAIDHNSPSEIAETLSPTIHEKEEGAAACIIIRYTPPLVSHEHEDAEQEVEDGEPSSFSTFSSLIILIKRIVRLKQEIQSSKKLFLGLAGIIIVILVISVLLSVKGRENTKRNQLFKEVLTSAQRKYDEGQNLMSLNKNIARDDFLQAYKLIKDNLSKFPKGTSEEKQLSEFLKKSQDAVRSSLETSYINPKEVSNNMSPLLSAIIEHHALFGTQDEERIYFLDQIGISFIDKKTKATKQIIKKDEYKNPVGLGTFFSNIYLIDDSKLSKFVSLGSGYAKTNYFPKDTNPDLSKAVSLTIDGAVWVLRNDGTIQKFLKGNVENFSVNGLDKQLNGAVRIFTMIDSSKLYVLDNGNSRIVVIDKDGTYKQQYQSDLIKKAKDFEIVEKDLPADRQGKKGYLLVDNKVFEFELK